jgi:hypothetical protein
MLENNPYFSNIGAVFSRKDFKSFLLFCIFCISILLSGCGNKKTDETPLTVRNLLCKPASKVFSYDEIVYQGQSGGGNLSLNDIRENIFSSCMNCHLAPSNSGNFTFIDSYQGEIRTIAGQTRFYPGYFEIAEKVYEYLNVSDDSKRMPPKERRDKNPELFLKISDQVNAWIQNGKPNGHFNLSSTGPAVDPIRQPRTQSSDLGECTPSAKLIGFDYHKDRMFENAQALPKDLSETDLFSLDAYELAMKGTVAYNVEYPLWADNNNKGRWIHLPVKNELLSYKKQKITYNPTTHELEVPDNTRFYKTFYKKVKQANGKFRYRRVETRLIVVRTPWEKSLFGSYKWDGTEQSATLVEVPYRDGTGFKDIVFQVPTDDVTGAERSYAIPGQQRCLDCHMGSAGRNTVLGFSALQINRRNIFEAGREEPISEAEKSQVQRFIEYGMFDSAAPSPDQWPKLETEGGIRARNIHELRAQGYMIGNCAHCHNPNGLAFTKENGINLDLTAGSIFQFNIKTKSTQIPSRLIVHQNGELDQSHIYRKISDSSAQLGMTSQMPMNTPGTPDCKALRLIGKWIRSFESEEAANLWEPSCKKENPFKWIDQDFTIADDPKNYTPKRSDWNDPSSGMSEKFRSLAITPELQAAFSKKYAVGYWSKKEICSFPDVKLDENDIRPWMMRGTQPKRPFGEIYTTTPGSWYYRTSCMKCHGEKADGNSTLARGILTWSGGSVRVANFMNGLFGDKNENLNKFITGSGESKKNYAPNYLVWMAMEGTRVQFPPEISSFLGKHGGQMLNQMRDKCINQISPNKPSSRQFMDHEIFEKICFINNKAKDDPDLSFDPATGKPNNPTAFEEWADQAAYNIGFSIFDFLKDMSAGNTLPGNDQCEIVYPK